MQRRVFVFGLAVSAASLGGCAGLGIAGASGPPQMAELLAGRGRGAAGAGAGAASLDGMMARQRLQMEMMNSPDLPAWHEQREKMALAIGDRSFDQPFDRVFDSITVALSTLGSRVNNMERTSGYITASIPELAPVRKSAMEQAGLRQYAVAKGYPPAVIEQRQGDPFGFGDMTGMMTRGMAGLTLSLVRQGAKRTKVKLRFDNVFFPEMVAEYYRLVWATVDKQMFLDGSLD